MDINNTYIPVVTRFIYPRENVYVYKMYAERMRCEKCSTEKEIRWKRYEIPL